MMIYIFPCLPSSILTLLFFTSLSSLDFWPKMGNGERDYDSEHWNINTQKRAAEENMWKSKSEDGLEWRLAITRHTRPGTRRNQDIFRNLIWLMDHVKVNVVFTQRNDKYLTTSWLPVRQLCSSHHARWHRSFLRPFLSLFVPFLWLLHSGREQITRRKDLCHQPHYSINHNELTSTIFSESFVACTFEIRSAGR